MFGDLFRLPIHLESEGGWPTLVFRDEYLPVDRDSMQDCPCDRSPKSEPDEEDQECFPIHVCTSVIYFEVQLNQGWLCAVPSLVLNLCELAYPHGRELVVLSFNHHYVSNVVVLSIPEL